MWSRPILHETYMLVNRMVYELWKLAQILRGKKKIKRRIYWGREFLCVCHHLYAATCPPSITSVKQACDVKFAFRLMSSESTVVGCPQGRARSAPLTPPSPHCTWEDDLWEGWKDVGACTPPPTTTTTTTPGQKIKSELLNTHVVHFISLFWFSP